jgi:hypothetical protein
MYIPCIFESMYPDNIFHNKWQGFQNCAELWAIKLVDYDFLLHWDSQGKWTAFMNITNKAIRCR